MTRLGTKNWRPCIARMPIDSISLEHFHRLSTQGSIVQRDRILKRAIHRLILLGAILGGSCPNCFADLQPSEVAIVAARGNRDSENLASYYARMRGVPPENICLVSVQPNEVCTRDQWQTSIRPEIHKWLATKDPQ